jgi:prepilin-type N-terminal cleavage/methylation domain-containing protein
MKSETANGGAFSHVRRRSASGFTLLEVVISSVIMAFVLLSTILVISRASKYEADLWLQTRSSQILRQEVEQLRTMSWGQVTNCPTTFTNPADSNNTFAGSVSLSPYQTVGSTTIVLRATVQVSWTNHHSRVLTNQLTTLISNGGLKSAQ